MWAAAVKAYRDGMSYEFNSGEIAHISEYIQEFGDPDPWLDKIAQYVLIRPEVTAADVLSHALELDPRQQGRREARRVADVLQSMGWRRLVTSRKDPLTGKSKSVRIWQRPKMILSMKITFLTIFDYTFNKLRYKYACERYQDWPTCTCCAQSNDRIDCWSP